MDIGPLRHGSNYLRPSYCGVRYSPPQANSLPQGECESAFGSRQFHVLWIDDAIDSNDADVGSLELKGFRVQCAMNAKDGLSLACTRTFDAILLDLRLSDGSGLDVLLALLDAGVTAPAVILTAFPDVETGISAMKLGAADYRTKPFDVEDIAGTLRRLIARRNQGQPDANHPLTEAGWLRIQCDRFADCFTRKTLAAAICRLLLDRRVSLRSFFGCAEAMRLVMTSDETSLTLLAGRMRSAILRSIKATPPRNPRLRDALAKLEHGGQKVSQQIFAEHVGLSRAYLSHRLTVETGRHAAEWSRGATMRDAARQVLESKEPISQIAYNLGYQHHSQFDRTFTQTFGASPTDLRRVLDSGEAHQY